MLSSCKFSRRGRAFSVRLQNSLHLCFRLGGKQQRQQTHTAFFELLALVQTVGRQGVVDQVAVTVRAQNRSGETFEITGEGMLGKCLCHELDHLDGIVYVDKMIEDVSDRYKMVTKGDK